MSRTKQRFMSSYFRYAAIIVLVVLVGFDATSQVKQTHRYEVKRRNMDDPYSIIPLREEGLLLLKEKNKYEGSLKYWDLTLLDTALKEVTVSDILVNYRYPFIGYEHAPGNLFLLFRTGDSPRNSFFLIHLTLPDLREISRNEIDHELEFKLTHFSRVGGNLVFGGYVSNEPAVFLFDKRNGQIKVLPGFFQKDNELVDLRVNHNETFNTVLVDRSLRNDRKLVFRTFDQSGTMLMEDVVSIDEGKTLQSSITSRLEREDLLLAGTWGDKQGKQSYGFFALPVDPFAEQEVTYFAFGELDHFTNYLNPKRAARIKEATRRDLDQGRRPAFTAYVMPYRITEHPKGYLMLAEVYDPVQKSNPYYNSPFSNPYYGSPYYHYNPFWPAYYYPGMRMYRPFSHDQTQRGISEVKTEASVLVAFDPNGNRLWDLSISLDDIEKSALEQITDYYFSGTHAYILYKKESELVGTIINIEDGSSEEVKQRIKTLEDLDEIRSDKDQDDGLRHWIDNTFYLWGYQTIRNIHNKDDRVRNVFYVNKVVVE